MLGLLIQRSERKQILLKYQTIKPRPEISWGKQPILSRYQKCFALIVQFPQLSCSSITHTVVAHEKLIMCQGGGRFPQRGGQGYDKSGLKCLFPSQHVCAPSSTVESCIIIGGVVAAEAVVEQNQIRCALCFSHVVRCDECEVTARYRTGLCNQISLLTVGLFVGAVSSLYLSWFRRHS